MLPNLKNPRPLSVRNSTPFVRLRRLGIPQLCLLAGSALMTLYGLYFAYRKCDTTDHMTMMLVKTTDIFQENDIEYWLDKGTLLGIHRDRELIPWEYDVDLGVLESSCDKISQLKEEFLKVGLIAYDRNDDIPHKVKVTYDTENHRFYMSDSHIWDPCIRVYDQADLGTWVDVYWYKQISSEKAKKMDDDKQILIPQGYHFDEDLLCCSEGLQNHTEVMCCGGCVPYSSIYPLKYYPVAIPYQGRSTRKEYMVQDPKQVLEHVYGPDVLSSREIKGWKGIVCSYHVNFLHFFFYLSILVGGIAFVIYKCLQPPKMGRRD